MTFPKEFYTENGAIMFNGLWVMSIDGLSIDGLSFDGLSIDGLTIDGLSIDGLRTVLKWKQVCILYTQPTLFLVSDRRAKALPTDGQTDRLTN